MGANNSSLTPLNCILKNWDKFDPQSLKKTCLIFCDTEWPRYPLEDGERWLVGGSLNYNTVLLLGQFCRKPEKWIEVAYVLPFFSLWGMPDLHPKGIDFGMKPSAPSCPPILPPYPGLQTEQTESQGTPPGRVALISVKIQTEIQIARVEGQTTPVLVRPQTTLVSIETQTIKVREAQTAKTKGEIQDEMEDTRQRDKENQVSPIYPWDHMCWTAREAGDQPHKLLPLHEASTVCFLLPLKGEIKHVWHL